MKRWALVAKERVFETPWLDVEARKMRSPRNGIERTFYVIDCFDYCNVIALTPEDEVVMVRQERHGSGEVTLELPGGIIDSGEAPAAAARRELREETGFVSERGLVPAGMVSPNPALVQNKAYTFVVRDVVCAHAPQMDESEDIEICMVPLRDIPAKIAQGEISSALVVAAFALALSLKGDLPRDA